MDVGGALFYIFAAISTLYVLHFGFYLIGANFYDVWQSRQQFKRELIAALGLARSYEPLVSMMIPAHNEEKVVERCLDSVLASSYANLQIIVVDDASKDMTSKIVRRYIREHPEVDMRLVTKRKNIGKGGALNYGLKRYARGELAMTLDADSILLPSTIANAVAYFMNPNIVGVAANVHIIEEPTILGMLQKFEHMIGYRSKKVYSLFNCEFVIGGVASTYRMDILRKVKFYDTDTLTEDIGLSTKITSLGNREHRIVYGANVVAMTEGVENFRALLRQRYRWKYGSLQNLVKYRRLIMRVDKRFTLSLTLYRMPVAVVSEVALVVAPLVWGYVLYLTLGQYNLGLILGAYLTISIYTAITLWSAENLSFLDRVRLTLYVPITYFIFYIMDFVQLIAALKCLKRVPALLAQKETGGAWISPPRIGREVIVR